MLLPGITSQCYRRLQRTRDGQKIGRQLSLPPVFKQPARHTRVLVVVDSTEINMDPSLGKMGAADRALGVAIGFLICPGRLDTAPLLRACVA